jgi:hypothetical protein
MERFWRWQPSEAKALTWSEIRNYAAHAEIMLKKVPKSG